MTLNRAFVFKPRDRSAAGGGRNVSSEPFRGKCHKTRSAKLLELTFGIGRRFVRDPCPQDNNHGQR